MDGIWDDLRHLGLFTTVGGPLTLAVCVAKLLGKTRVSWLWLAPPIATYGTILVYALLFGIKLEYDFLITWVVLLSLSKLFCIAVVACAHRKHKYKIPIYDATTQQWIKAISGIIVAYAIATGFFSLNFFAPSFCQLGSFTATDVSGIKCLAAANTAGFQGYIGYSAVPLLICSALTTWLLVIFFIGKKRAS